MQWKKQKLYYCQFFIPFDAKTQKMMDAKSHNSRLSKALHISQAHGCNVARIGIQEYNRRLKPREKILSCKLCLTKPTSTYKVS